MIDDEPGPTIAETIARFRAMAADLKPKKRSRPLHETLGPHHTKLPAEAFERFRPRRAALKWLKDAPDCVIASYDNGGRDTRYRYTVLLGGRLWDLDYARANWESGLDPRLMPCLLISDSLDMSVWTDRLRGPRLGRQVCWLDMPDRVRDHVMRRVGKTRD